MEPDSQKRISKSSISSKLPKKESSDHFDDVEFSSSVLRRPSNSSLSRQTHSSSQCLSKYGRSHPRNQIVTNFETSELKRGQSASLRSVHNQVPSKILNESHLEDHPKNSLSTSFLNQDSKCPHCSKTFSKRFSVPRHVEVSLKRTVKNSQYNLYSTFTDLPNFQWKSLYLWKISEFMIERASFIVICVDSNAYQELIWRTMSGRYIEPVHIVREFLYI